MQSRPAFLVSADAILVAAACRRGGLAFLEGARSGWTQHDLEHWLATHYASVSLRLDGDDDEGTPESSLRPRGVADLVELVGVAVSAALDDLAADPRPLLDEVLGRGAVVTMQNDDGPLWLPVDRPDLDLETRVLSLFATDYLLDPDAYENELSVCAECDCVSFDAFGQCPICSASQSGMRRIERLWELRPSMDSKVG